MIIFSVKNDVAWVKVMEFKATFNKILAISRRSVLLVE